MSPLFADFAIAIYITGMLVIALFMLADHEYPRPTNAALVVGLIFWPALVPFALALWVTEKRDGGGW